MMSIALSLAMIGEGPLRARAEQLASYLDVDREDAPNTPQTAAPT
jgi:hypothetical protein